jgi:elongator complex protein 3
MRKVTRTVSGVTPVAVMVEPRDCPGECVYCPTHTGAPKSYTTESPVVLRARAFGYDAILQVENRLRILADMGHPTDKVELIIMGGTFPSYPVDYQYRFIKGCYDALNSVHSADLAEAKVLNERAKQRCVGLCIETRPDFCDDEGIGRMLEFGATRVELGVQAIDDEIYRLVRRGHTVSDVVSATRRLKDVGLKVYYHWMPGLPGSTPTHDMEMSRTLFEDSRFRPDGLKLYPTLVIEGTELEEWHRAGRYQPYPEEEMLELLARIKAIVPGYVRISRVMRDIPTKFIVAGMTDLGLRGDVRLRMQEMGASCHCIRCREYGHRRRDHWTMRTPTLHRIDYEASGGLEVFLTFEDDAGTLFGLLRLRVKSGDDSAYVREMHTFGPEAPVGEKPADVVQHSGLGRRLLAEAERLAFAEFDVRRILVLAGVGARAYFRDEGFALEGSYMIKELDGGSTESSQGDDNVATCLRV